MKEKKYLGKTRLEIAQKLGYGNNCFENDTWIYLMGRTWIGRKSILSIVFKDDKVAEIHIKKTFRRTIYDYVTYLRLVIVMFDFCP